MIKSGYRLLKYFCLLVVAVPSLSYASPIVSDVNPRKIDIDQNFKGLELLVYGARNDAGNVVIVVRGPKEKQILRKKDRVFGVWTNVENIELNSLYSYYGIASTKPLTAIQNDTLLKELEIGVNNIDLSQEKISHKKADKIKQSIINLMQNKNLYPKDYTEISFWGENLFRSFINFPKNISEGVYDIDIYLFNDGLLRTFQTMPVIVEKVGLEAFVHDMAFKRPLTYGLISVFFALFMGFSVGMIFAKRQ